MRIRDSLSGELRELQPGADGVIGVYVCGPTVYDRIHVGNARPFVVFQLMKRYLEWRGQAVLLVENITDINDKIYAAAVRLGVPSDHLAQEMSGAYIADTDLLGLGRPDREPRGDVYFAVRSFDRYGMLSNQRIDQLLEGAGSAEPGEHKRDPLDFALWKGNKPGEDTWWDSPWGRGRPGWHIECSAMSERWLGREFALHGGGRDLIFPHHENEIAQSEAGGRPFAQVWAHNGMLRLSGEKMAKSVGNIEPLHEAVEKWGAETLIMFLLRGHYASPIDYDDEALEQARRAAATLRNRLRDGGDAQDEALRLAVCEALDEDFNTPRALALLFDAPPESAGTVAEVLDVLGLGGLAHEEQAPTALLDKARERDAARVERDFARADAVRDEIEAAGWEVRDTAGGTVLYRRHDG
jgi:cysteinyl-tRNA synthetase